MAEFARATKLQEQILGTEIAAAVDLSCYLDDLVYLIVESADYGVVPCMLSHKWQRVGFRNIRAKPDSLAAYYIHRMKSPVFCLCTTLSEAVHCANLHLQRVTMSEALAHLVRRHSLCVSAARR